VNRKTWVQRVGPLVAAGSAAFGLTGFPLAGAAANAAAANPTANPYSPAYGHPYRHGVIPTRQQQSKMDGWAAEHSAGHARPTTSKTLSYGGGIGGAGVTSGTPKVYLVFWGSGWNSDDPGAAYIQSLFNGLGTGGEQWSGTMTQYCDGPAVAYGATSCPSGASLIGYPANGVVAGVWTDPSMTSTTPSAHQIAQEAVDAAAHFGNITPDSNRDVQYDILSPHGSSPDGWLSPLQWCAWHDSTSDGYTVSPTAYGNLAFTNMPYVMDVGSSCGASFVNPGSAGTLDGYSIVNGHEYAETLTDQYPATGWTNFSNGEENGDECAWISSGQGASADVAMGTGTFAMQSTWSNDTNECDISHPTVTSGGGGGTSSTMTVTISAGTVSQTRKGYQVPLTVHAAANSSPSAPVGGAGVALNVYQSTCSGTAIASGSTTTNSSGNASFSFSTKSGSTTYCARATVTHPGYTNASGTTTFTA
jgi:serine protease